MLKNSEQLKRTILEKRTKITREELEHLVKEKKKNYAGFLSDEGALRLIGQELQVQFEEESTIRDELPIKKLVSGLSDVNVIGRIISLWPPKSFKRKDGTAGSLLRFILTDKTGMITCILWTPDIMKFSSNELKGKIVKINHAYTKDNLGKETELHIGDKGEITIVSNHFDDNDYPNIENLIQDIDKINLENSRVNIRVQVKTEPRILTFSRKGVNGIVSRIRVFDQTAETTIVIWNQDMKTLQKLTAGKKIEVLNGKVKRGFNNIIEVHVTKNSILNIC